jgi:hypothetical protein
MLCSICYTDSIFAGNAEYFYPSQGYYFINSAFCQGDSRGNVNILGVVKISHRDKKVHMNTITQPTYYTFTFTITLLCLDPLHVSGVKRPSSGGTTLAVFDVSCVHL